MKTSETDHTIFIERWETVPDYLKEAAMDLGSFAFRMLVDQHAVFRYEQFRQGRLSRIAYDLGLLESCCDLQYDSTPQWRFAHLSMQEALAARFVANRITTEDIPWLVGELGPLTGHLNTFYRCLAAELDQTGVDSLIRAIFSAPTSTQGTEELHDQKTSGTCSFRGVFGKPLAGIV